MYRFILIGLIAFMAQSCIGFLRPIEDPDYTPVIMSRSTFESEVGMGNPQPVVNPGKIYIFGNLLYVGEKNKGFHVYDNSNPQDPVKIKFLSAPGATDISIKNNVFYIIQATDLISITHDLSFDSYITSKRLKNVFNQKVSPNGWTHDLKEDEIIIEWVRRED